MLEIIWLWVPSGIRAIMGLTWKYWKDLKWKVDNPKETQPNWTQITHNWKRHNSKHEPSDNWNEAQLKKGQPKRDLARKRSVKRLVKKAVGGYKYTYTQISLNTRRSFYSMYSTLNIWFRFDFFLLQLVQNAKKRANCSSSILTI